MGLKKNKKNWLAHEGALRPETPLKEITLKLNFGAICWDLESVNFQVSEQTMVISENEE